jgi:hypothetical protein
MTLIRTTITVLIAVAIALLPVSGNAIALPSDAEATMADHADMPCCPDCNTQGDFKATGCALKCAALAGAAVLPVMTVALLIIAGGPALALAEDAMHEHVSAPAHRPPI